MQLRDIRLDAKVHSKERLMVFGAGEYSKILCNYYGIEHIKKNVELFIVSSKEGNPDCFMEIPVETLECKIVNNYDNVNIIVAVAKHNRIGIEDLLKSEFKRVIFLEEFADMSIFQNKLGEDRNKEIENYYRYFIKHKPLFKYIEIETVNRCNGGCSFCPVNRFEKQRPYAQMTESLFQKIINQLETLNYDGKLALFSNNEAFLDKRIIEFAQYAKAHLPKTYIYITTNGTMLNDVVFAEIIPYLDGLNIDIYKPDMDEEDPQNIKDILQLAVKLDVEEKIKVSRIDEHAIRSSRGGTSPNSKVSYTIKDKCPLLLVQMVIRPDGKVSLCCNDALGAVTLGDLTKESILDIWYGKTYDDFRTRIMGSRNNINLCKYCDFVDMREL